MDECSDLDVSHIAEPAELLEHERFPSSESQRALDGEERGLIESHVSIAHA